jgi:hypothetical protein
VNNLLSKYFIFLQFIHLFTHPFIHPIIISYLSISLHTRHILDGKI